MSSDEDAPTSSRPEDDEPASTSDSDAGPGLDDYEAFLEFEQARRRESGLPPLDTEELTPAPDEAEPQDELLNDVLSQLQDEEDAPRPNLDLPVDDRDSVLPESQLAAVLSERPPAPDSRSAASSTNDEAPESGAAPSGVVLEHDDALLDATARGLGASPLSDLHRAGRRTAWLRAGIAAAILGGLAWVVAASQPDAEEPKALTRPLAPPTATTTLLPAPRVPGEAAVAASGQTTAQHATPAAAPATSGVDVSADGSPAALARLEKRVHADACEIPEGLAPAGVHASEQALRKGRAALARGAPERARVALCLASHHNPRNFMVSAALVQTYLLLGDARSAANVAASAVERHPSNRMIGELYGDALASAGDVDAAVTQWMVALRLEESDRDRLPAVARSYVQAAKEVVSASDPAQALRLLRRAALMDPQSRVAAEAFARLLSARGEARAAIGWAQRATRLAPEAATAHVVLGDVLRDSGDAEKAMNAYRKALELDPDQPDAKRGLAAK